MFKAGDRIIIVEPSSPNDCYEIGNIGELVGGPYHKLWMVRMKWGMCRVWEREFKLLEEDDVKKHRHGIRIQAQETAGGNIEILGYDCLQQSNLPSKYLEGSPRVYIHESGAMHVSPGSTLGAYKLIPGAIVPKQQFEEILTTCRAAGSRLREINERPEPFEVVI